MEREVESKNKMIYIILSMIFIVMIVSFGITKIMDYLERREQQRIFESKNFKSEIIEKEDGWYYFLTVDRLEIEKGKFTYHYYLNGCNLKYATLDYSYGIVDNGSDSYHIPISPPSLTGSHRSKNNSKTEGDELKEINDFFSSTTLNKKITVDDLNELDLINFKADEIVELWNPLYERKFLTEYGKYTSLPVCNFSKTESETNYFQVGVLISYGYIEQIRMDYVNEKKEYLTDKIENQTASEDEQQLYENIQNIENTVMEKQSFDVEDSYSDLKNDSFYTPLFDLLNQYEAKK